MIVLKQFANGLFSAIHSILFQYLNVACSISKKSDILFWKIEQFWVYKLLNNQMLEMNEYDCTEIVLYATEYGNIRCNEAISLTLPMKVDYRNDVW